MPRQQLIKFRKGSAAPVAADFQESEPAWDGTNKKLYVKAADGSMAEIGGGGGGSTTNASDLTSGTLAMARLPTRVRAAVNVTLWSNFR